MRNPQALCDHNGPVEMSCRSGGTYMMLPLEVPVKRNEATVMFSSITLWSHQLSHCAKFFHYHTVFVDWCIPHGVYAAFPTKKKHVFFFWEAMNTIQCISTRKNWNLSFTIITIRHSKHILKNKKAEGLISFILN